MKFQKSTFSRKFNPSKIKGQHIMYAVLGVLALIFGYGLYQKMFGGASGVGNDEAKVNLQKLIDAIAKQRAKVNKANLKKDNSYYISIANQLYDAFTERGASSIVDYFTDAHYSRAYAILSDDPTGYRSHFSADELKQIYCEFNVREFIITFGSNKFTDLFGCFGLSCNNDPDKMAAIHNLFKFTTI